MIDLYSMKKVLKKVYLLNLSKKLNNHDTFHTFVLKSHSNNFLFN